MRGRAIRCSASDANKTSNIWHLACVDPCGKMGGEDFAYFLDKAPGAFFHIGCSSPEDTVRSALHTPGFNPDEGCIEIGIAMETALAMEE